MALRSATGAAAALAALLCLPSAAHAGDLAAAVRVANTVYPSVPQRCGTVAIQEAPLPGSATHGELAEAFELQCKVLVRPGIAAQFDDAQLCSLLVHEWGHLAGLRFSNNPSDPYHSADPHHHMYGPSLVHHRACGETREEAEARWVREASEDNARQERQSQIRDELSDLRDRLQKLKTAKRRAHAAKRPRYARRIRRVRARMARLRTEYRSLEAHTAERGAHRH